MSTGTQLDFNYADPEDGSPLFITVRYEGQPHPVDNSGDQPTTVHVNTNPGVASGMLAIVFSEEYYPLPLYCDGMVLSIPALSGGEVPVLTPSVIHAKKTIRISPINPDLPLKEYIITVTDSTQGGATSIGIMIVGTAGLGDGHPTGN